MRSVRFFYKKHGNMKFISHLDINRFMIKMVRRSKIPVWYSEGYNPHPYITFALPLSLGFESEYEVMDIRLDDDSFSNQDAFNMLKKCMPQGIELFDYGDPIMKAGQVAYASFDIFFEESIENHIDKLNNFFKSEVIKAEKKTKKGGIKTIDLKEYIKDYSLSNNRIKLVLSAGANNLNPKLVLDSYCSSFSENLSNCSITRTMLFDEQMNCFK